MNQCTEEAGNLISPIFPLYCMFAVLVRTSSSRVVPLALALLNISHPDFAVIDQLSRLTHDADADVAQSAIMVRLRSTLSCNIPFVPSDPDPLYLIAAPNPFEVTYHAAASRTTARSRVKNGTISYYKLVSVFRLWHFPTDCKGTWNKLKRKCVSCVLAKVESVSCEASAPFWGHAFSIKIFYKPLPNKV